jgi:hypothetical protein
MKREPIRTSSFQPVELPCADLRPERVRRCIGPAKEQGRITRASEAAACHPRQAPSWPVRFRARIRVERPPR